MGFLSSSIKEERSLISIKIKIEIYLVVMTEQMLNEIVSSVVYALKMEGSKEITEGSLFDLMYRHENIYQIVLSKRSSKRKAKLIKKEMMEMVVDKINTEGMTLKEKLRKSIAEKKREREKGVYKENNMDGIRYKYNDNMKICI